MDNYPASSVPVCIFYRTLSFVGASVGEILFQLADRRHALVLYVYLSEQWSLISRTGKFKRYSKNTGLKSIKVKKANPIL